MRANQKKINVKKNLNETFSPEKFETKAIEISVLCY